MLSFRRRAQAAGNLKSDDKQVVKAEEEIIIIEPANPQVIYVPQYTPSTVVTYGVAPVYGYYPAPYPSYYYPYPPGAALATGLIWGAAIGAAWNGGHWGADYHGGDINVNVDRNTNINRGDRGSGSGQRPSGTSGSSWKSNKQPGQVSSSVGKSPSAGRPGDARGGAGAGNYGAGGARASTQPGGGAAGAGGARASTQPGGGAVGGGAARPSTQPSGGGVGSAGASRPGTQPSGGYGGSSTSRGGDAFGGYSSGRQAQMDSSRGASSRSSMSGGGGRSALSGGGARGGGGGRGGGGRR